MKSGINLFRRIVMLFLFSVTCIVSANEKQRVLDYDAGVQDDCKLSVAKFRLWMPESVNSAINGVFIVTPGRNKDGRNAVKHPKYRKLAEKWKFAVMGNFLKGTEKDKDTYQLDFKGNTAALILQALNKFADDSGHNELKTAPVFLFGISAGGNVSVQFPGFYPERTIGVAARVPTVGPGINATEKLKVPMLIAIGGKDRKEWVRFSDRMWGKYGGKSVWTYAKHKDLEHTANHAEDLVFIYADSVLKQRLVLNGRDNAAKLSEVAAGWVGELSTYEIQKNELNREKGNACWLPDEAAAIAWRKYLTSSFKK